jgi:hypothetical protein
MLGFELGNRILGPRRVPFLESFQFPSAVDRFARPDEYASLEFSGHHGAASSFTWFHSFRKEYADQFSDGVSSSSGMP